MAKKVKKSKKTTKKVSKPATKAATKVKKTTKKKISKKKSTKKATPTKKFIKAKGEHCFFLIDGSTISDLHGLADALDVMSHDVFYYHVDGDRNDFANWVREILKEAELADALLGESTPERCQIVVLRHFLK